MSAPQYSPTWESLITYGTPEWFSDTKFGIYAHWGLYSIPGYGTEWYGKQMYDPSHPTHAEHVRRYGSPAKFGYKDFVSQFTAERFDPDEWAELFAASGAGYAGFSLAHHDGFGLWDSEVYRWNVGKMGPKRDLYGELAVALRRRGLRLVAPFHIIRGYNWFLPGWDQWKRSWDEKAVELGRREGWDLYDPAYKDFYWNELSGADFAEFVQLWKAKVTEVIDKYQPDLMWFDGGRFTEADLSSHSLEVLAYYLNRSVEWKKQVVVLNKLPVSMRYNFHPDFGVWQYEEGRDRPEVVDRPWNDDMRVGDKSWGWVEGQSYRTGGELLHGLIDRVARGGSLMLSLSPAADGTIPEGQRQSLEAMGRWLRANDEAVTGTRAWKVQSEGDIQKLKEETGNGHEKWMYRRCNGSDHRYTASADGKRVYAFTLGRPSDPVSFAALGQAAGNLSKKPAHVSLLGSSNPAIWTWETTGLRIRLTEEPADPSAYVWKITL